MIAEYERKLKQEDRPKTTAKKRTAEETARSKEGKEEAVAKEKAKKLKGQVTVHTPYIELNYMFTGKIMICFNTRFNGY